MDSIPLDASTLGLTASYNYNKTEVTRIAPNPAALDGLGANLVAWAAMSAGRIEEGCAARQVRLTGDWNLERWDFNAGATRYGEFTTRHASNPAQDQTFGAKWTLDLSRRTSAEPALAWTAGRGQRAGRIPGQNIYANSTFGMIPYSLYSPFGFNGRYVYGRVAYKW